MALHNSFSQKVLTVSYSLQQPTFLVPADFLLVAWYGSLLFSEVDLRSQLDHDFLSRLTEGNPQSSSDLLIFSLHPLFTSTNCSKSDSFSSFCSLDILCSQSNSSSLFAFSDKVFLSSISFVLFLFLD